MSSEAPNKTAAVLLGEGAKVVCNCMGVTELEIRTTVDVHQASTVEHVTEKTGAGSGCRACHCRIRRVINGLPASCGGPCSRCEGCNNIQALCSCCSEKAEEVA